MTGAERKEAIKAIKSNNNDIYNPEINKYRIQQIITGILAGGALVAYIVQKGVEPIQNIQDLPFEGYIQETRIWLQTKFFPNLRNFPALWETIKGNNGLEHLTAALSGLLTTASLVNRHKKIKEIKERNAANREEIRNLGR